MVWQHEPAIAVEAEQGVARASIQQRDQFFERIFDHSRSIFNPKLWLDTGVGLGVLTSNLGLLLKNWWAEVGPKGDPVGLLLVPLFVIIFAGGYMLINRWAKRWMTRYAQRSRSIDDMARLWRIVRGLITISVLPLILILLVVSLALVVYARRWVSRYADGLLQNASKRGRMVWSILASTGEVIVPTLGMIALSAAILSSGTPGEIGALIAVALPFMGFVVFAAAWLGSHAFPRLQAEDAILPLPPEARIEGRLGAPDAFAAASWATIISDIQVGSPDRSR
jgi:hypothetical protein